ncbi:MAG: hypothetical protein R3C62_19575 [Chloroflexota bacterium]
MSHKNQIWNNVKGLGYIICLLFLSGCEAELDNPQWVTIKHEQYNFSLEYPTKWVADIYGDAGRKGVDDEKLVIEREESIFGRPSSPTTFIIIVERRAFDNPSLQDALNWGNETIARSLSQEGLQTKPGYEEFLSQKENVAGYPAIRRRYTYFGLGEVIREEIYFPRKNDMITLSLNVSGEYFDNFYPDFQRIVASFKTISPEMNS